MKFCTECGSKVKPSNGAYPKFCSECGNAFGAKARDMVLDMVGADTAATATWTASSTNPRGRLCTRCSATTVRVGGDTP